MNLKNISRAGKCLNCATPLNSESDNFCPNCGQLNNVKKETAIGLVKELVEEFLHLDSKVLRSLKPLLFKPGFLTVDYISGKRARYFHPVRMFLTITIVMFIIGGLSGTKEVVGIKNKKTNAKDTRDVSRNDSLKVEKDSVYIYDTEEGIVKQAVESGNEDSSTNLSYSFGKHKVGRDSLQYYLDKGIHDPKVLMDTFQIEKTFFNTIFFSQIVKTQLSGKTKIWEYYKHKLPWLLFTLMPVFAFVLYLFYVRRKIFFVDHLIHAFHLHSAVFVIITIDQIFYLISGINTSWIYLYIPLYYFISLKKVYGQTISKTIFKGIGIGVFYFILGILALFVVAAIMFLMI